MKTGKKSRLAIIPARSGSKGLKNKNIKDLNGKPLLAYSIEAAIKSKCFDKVMVSTDSQQYADIAVKCGADVPFLRSKSSSNDKSDKWDVVREVLDEYSKKEKSFSDVCVLQPTSPLRSAEDIINAYEILDCNDANAVVSVCVCEHPPAWTGRIKESGLMDDFNRKEMFLTRQELGDYYRLNGAIFIAKTDLINDRMSIYSDRCYAYKMPINRSVDIDTLWDFTLAEFLLNHMNGGN